MTELIWIQKARAYLGQKEVPGPASNPWILSLWSSIAWIWTSVARKDDSLLPWCGAFVRQCLVESNLTPPKNWFRAKEYVTYGAPLSAPKVGAIGVILTGKQWHVAFIVGRTKDGNIVMLGGNQNDSVKLSAFRPAVFQAFRWPDSKVLPDMGELPVIDVTLSTSQA